MIIGMISPEIGQKVYHLRAERGWTQEACAHRVGISCRTLQMIEGHQVQPTVTTLRKLAEAFECGWESLLGKATQRIEMN